MTDLAYPTAASYRAAPTRTFVRGALSRIEVRRALQLVLAAIWLVDGVLQLQATFFTKSFGSQMIGPMSAGVPGFLGHSITWSGAHIASDAQLSNAVFAAIQILLGLGIAWRPALRWTLAASVAWSIGVWWIGEGLGGITNGGADPVNGAPGAVILYALLAVLLWPRKSSAGSTSPFVAAMAVGTNWAKALWLVLWGSLAYFAVAGANSAPQGLHDLISGEADGEPGWIAWLDRNAASPLSHDGLAISIVLAVLLGIVAIGVYLPARFVNPTLVLAIVLALAFWVIGENFGALLAGGATDVNSGPLLVLLAASYWYRAVRRASSAPDGALVLSTEGA